MDDVFSIIFINAHKFFWEDEFYKMYNCILMTKKIEKDINANLLWTGGWDSTFQLLQLLLIDKVHVTPYYLIDENRSSTLNEIGAMRKIKEHLVKEYPHVKELLKATQYHTVYDISSNQSITESYQSILKKCKIGIQHEWLARFCEEKDIKNMQLSVEAPIKEKPTQFFRIHIKPKLVPSKIGNQKFNIIDPKFKNSDEYQLFKYFSFPIINITKFQMNEIVNNMGWRKIMDMTWFCHVPLPNNEPCGLCTPCTVALDQSMGWRISAKRRTISYGYRNLFLPLKSKLRLVIIKTGLISDNNKVQ